MKKTLLILVIGMIVLVSSLAFIVLVGSVGIKFWENSSITGVAVSDLNGSEEIEEEKEEVKINDNFPNAVEKHWGHMPIKYQRINEGGCDGVQFDKIADAFNIIEKSTEGIVSFVEVEQNPDIGLICLDREKLVAELKEAVKEVQVCKNITFNYRKEVLRHYSDDDGLDRNTHVITNTKLLKISSNETIYQVCYGDVNEIRSPSENFLKDISFDVETLGHAEPLISGNMITGAKIYFFKAGQGWTSCIFPAKEIHEVLHTFWFGHSYEPYWDPQYGYTDWSYVRDIMFPRLYCDQQKELNEKYISCLKKIYFDGDVVTESCADVVWITEEIG